jgi:CRP-like cAMP-binding protein
LEARGTAETAEPGSHLPTYHLTAVTTSAFCLLLCLLLLPVLVLLWATESKQQRARRWRRNGLTQQAIAERLGCSRRTVGRLLAA